MTAPASVPALRIFAGTTEGRLLCEWASGAGIPARAYAATEYGGELLGELPGIEVHAGRLDEADMERELSGARIVVDATHPFATLASGNIRAASLAVGARCLRLARPVEALPKGVVSVASIACAARFLSENPGRALLTTGSKELAPYTRVADFAKRFFVRVLPLPGAITKCIDAGFSPSHVIGMQGPFTRELNEAMLRQVGAQWLVTKDSGTVGGTAEKIACRARRGSALYRGHPSRRGKRGPFASGSGRRALTGVRALGARRACAHSRPRGGAPRASSNRTRPSSAKSSRTTPGTGVSSPSISCGEIVSFFAAR